MDPTIVFYMGTNKSLDLDTSDAHFVDVMHTGAGILGQWGPNGHADFYLNGGTSQPGCAHDTIFSNFYSNFEILSCTTYFLHRFVCSAETLSCDHTKVTPYFIESINSPEGFWAGPCANLVSYLIGWCEPRDNEYVLMGEHVNHQ